jgi:hypothetical protein
MMISFLASIVVVILAQLMPQIISALYPVQFLELSLMRQRILTTPTLKSVLGNVRYHRHKTII